MHESDEDWSEEAASVTPLRPRQKIRPLPPSPATRQIRKPVSATPPPISEMKAPGSIERHLLTRIRKRKEPIDARLDLHGMTQEEAFAALSAFLTRNYAGGARTALVITGKGRGGEGTLRRAFSAWIETEALRGYVAGYHMAAPADGGHGAWYVRLKRHKDGA